MRHEAALAAVVIAVGWEDADAAGQAVGLDCLFVFGLMGPSGEDFGPGEGAVDGEAVGGDADDGAVLFVEFDGVFCEGAQEHVLREEREVGCGVEFGAGEAGEGVEEEPVDDDADSVDHALLKLGLVFGN